VLRDTRRWPSARTFQTGVQGALPYARPFLAARIPVSARTSQAWLRWFNSAFASRLFRVASIAAMQRSLKPQRCLRTAKGQHRGDPPFRRCGCLRTATICPREAQWVHASASVGSIPVSREESGLKNVRRRSCVARATYERLPSAIFLRPFRSRGIIISAPWPCANTFERGGCRRDSCREYQSRRVSLTSRGTPLRTGG
jgi:hypothetical protein